MVICLCLCDGGIDDAKDSTTPSESGLVMLYQTAN